MTIGSHQQCVGKSQSHITPRWILDRLGPFDCDPCAADPRPWDCARVNYTERDDGLSKRWTGRVWMNPVFHRYQVGEWIERMAEHNHGILLLHVRPETKWFMPVWQHASGILFLDRRVHFHLPDGTRQSANSGAPVALIAFGAKDLACLRRCGIPGTLVAAWEDRR